MSDTTIDDIYSPLIMNNDTCMECGVNFKEAKSALYDLILKEVIGTQEIYDITDASPDFIAGYNNMAEATRIMRAGQYHALKELFDE